MLNRVINSKKTAFVGFIVAGLMLVAAGSAYAQSPATPPLDGLEVQRSTRTGLATFVTAANKGHIPLNAAKGGGPVQPIDFVAGHGALFGITDSAKQLVETKSRTDGIGHTHTTYDQVHRGVPVFAGVLKVHQNAAGQVIAANGHFFPISDDVSAKPTIPAAKAEAVATATFPEAALAIQRSELVIVDPGWYGNPSIGARLAYHVVVVADAPLPIREGFFIDAHTAAIIDRWKMLDNARNRQIYNGNGGSSIPGTLARTEGQGANANVDVNRAYDYAGDTYDYYYRAFGRDGLDAIGGALLVTVNSTAPGCPNAYWDGTRMVFCAGTVTDDVMAHELSHGVTEHTANLIYLNQSGQLNESFSDVFGELVDLFNGNAAFAGTPGGTPSWPTHSTGAGLDTPNNHRTTTCSTSPGYANGMRWLTGEDATAFGGAIRDMWNPHCMGDPDRANDTSVQSWCGGDNGGVHTGSGIPNHTFAILTDGTTFNGHTVVGIGPIKAGAVWYRALSVYLTASSDFSDAYTAFNQAAADLVGTYPNDPRTGLPSADAFTATDATQVNQALLATEMNTDGVCGGNLPPPTISSITPNSAPNLGSVTITDLAGTHFVAGATVKLTKSGQSNISASMVTLVSSTRITCTLRLSWVAIGTWNVVVTNPDGQAVTLTNGFTVTASPPGLMVDLPNGGETWALGSTRTILWGSVGGGPTVAISLLRAGSVVSQLASGLSNTGTFNWIISSGLPEGTDYRVRITDGTYTDESNADFSLQRYNDDCGSAYCIRDGVAYTGSTTAATGADITSCATGDSLDVWHSYTPATTGTVILSTDGSSFDTTLAVFSACGGTQLACDDDSGPGLSSQITMNMVAGTPYLIRVAGYAGATGTYTLLLTGGNGACGPHPPAAQSSNVEISPNTPANIALQATDDGLPNPPGAMSFTILSLPAHGGLSDPNGGAITTVPYALISAAGVVTYAPHAGYLGSDNFTFKANDGGTSPDGGDSSVATVTIHVVSVIYLASMDTDPGWTLDADWAWGHPTGGGSSCHDPSSGHTGVNVVGYNLAGDYPDNLTVRYAQTPAIDCSQYEHVQLKFYRWLGIEPSTYDHAAIEVSNNGTTWTTVYNHTASTICDSAWIPMEYDISAVADGKATVYIRWSMGPTDSVVTYPGWNIDDVELIGDFTGPRAPVVQNSDVNVQPDTSANITLQAADDGLPNPPGAISYIIVSLPAQGGLSDPNGGAITTVPYTLLSGGRVVTYAPNTGYLGSDSFTFKANDGGTSPDGGDSSIATVTMSVAECRPPAPANPTPGDAAMNVWADANLSWNTASASQPSMLPPTIDGAAFQVGDFVAGTPVPAEHVAALGRVVDTIGAKETLATGGAKIKGNFFECTSAASLVESEFYLAITTESELRFFVYEAATKTSTSYTKISDVLVSSPGTGEKFYNSGPINVSLVPGRFYAIGAGWAGTADYWYNAGHPSPVAFGGSYNGLASVSYPPPGTVAYENDVAQYYQRLTTEFEGPSCQTTYDVYFGTDNPPTTKISSDLIATTWDPGTLQPSTHYFWQVVAKNCCGQTPGPVWSFTTCDSLATPTSPQAAPSTICVGQSSTLSATVGAGETVDWFTDSCGGTPVPGGDSPTVNPTVTTDYYARARNSTSGCVSSGCAPVTVTVHLPVAIPTNAQANPSGICVGQCAALTATPGSGGDVVEWFTESCGGTEVPDPGNVCPAQSTTYYARTKNLASGCVSTACAEVTVTVTSSPPPAPANVTPADNATDVPTDVDLSWSSGGGGPVACGIQNGGFETGDFTGWTPVAGSGGQLQPWTIATAGLGWFSNGSPLEGTYYVQNGFDGGAGLTYDIYQDVAIPVQSTSAIIQWSERIQWQMTPYGATLPRTYTVTAEVLGSGNPVVLHSQQLLPGTDGDTGYVTHSVNAMSVLSGVAGATIRINFHEQITETNTGPAQFDLDGVSVTCNGTVLPAEQLVARTVGKAASAVSSSELTARYQQIRSLATSDYRKLSVTFGRSATTAVASNPIVVRHVSGASAGSCLVVNGDFEMGNLAGWSAEIGGPGNWPINDGTFIPLSGDGPLPPCGGAYAAVSDMNGPGIYTLYQDVTIPAGAGTAVLRWKDMVRSQAPLTTGLQEFKVDIRNPANNQVLGTVFSTSPSDPPIAQQCTQRTADLSVYKGQAIRVAFVVNSQLFFLNAHLDDVCIDVSGGACPVTYDVYFGTTNPPTTKICEDVFTTTCDPGTLQLGTFYYWQVVAKDCCGQTPGPVWSFTTLIPGDFDHDGDVDQEDFGHLQTCLTETGIIQPDPGCQDAMLDGDNDVDEADVAIFRYWLTGPRVVGDPNLTN